MTPNPHEAQSLSREPLVIRFYRANEKPYGAFSNLYRRPLLFDDVQFPTAEHAYQAGRPRRREVCDWLMAAPSPALLALTSHCLPTWEIASDWTHRKIARMEDVLRAKFTQHEDLARLLLSTGAARLVECGTTDNAVNRFWGEVNGKGKNMLGQLLVRVRDELRSAATFAGP